MTFTQILVLVVVICVSAVQCVSLLAKASVIKRKIGIPDDAEIAKNVVGAIIQADNAGATVMIRFSDCGTEINYMPREDDEPVQDGD